MSGVADLPMADQLYHYMVGGHKRPLVCVFRIFKLFGIIAISKYIYKCVCVNNIVIHHGFY